MPFHPFLHEDNTFEQITIVLETGFSGNLQIEEPYLT